MLTYSMEIAYQCEKYKLKEDKRQEKKCDSRYVC